MIDPSVVEAFNSRQTVDLNSIKTMTAAEQDRVKTTGSAAENLLKNRDFAVFVHQYKFEVCDQLSEIVGHTVEDNLLRVSLANQIRGIDAFVNTLKRSVYFRNRVVTLQTEKVQQGPEA